MTRAASLIRPGLVAALSLAVPLLGCDTAAPTDENADQIAADIEADTGNLDTSDEAPMFGDPLLFSDEGLDDVETDIDDSIAGDAEVVAMRDAADSSDAAAAYDVLVAWGHADFTRDFGEPRDWSGTLRVNRGAIVVRRAIRFDRGDAILPRDDRTAVSFHSVTGPHHDGLRLLVLDPDPTSDQPLTLSYELGDVTHDVAIDTLLDGPESVDVDDLGNRVVAVAERHRLDPCARGFMRGRWRQVRQHFGVLRGRIASADGELTGHMRGIYGVRRDGSHVFFGKAIGTDGSFRGLFAGRYRAGRFAGRWLNREGEFGVLGGAYRESATDARVGGHFIGRWAETSCNMPIDPDAP